MKRVPPGVPLSFDRSMDQEAFGAAIWAPVNLVVVLFLT